MSDLEFNIQISGSNNDSNLVLKSESAVINDTQGEASTGSSENVSALEKKLKLLDALEEIKFELNQPIIPPSLLPKNGEQLLYIAYEKNEGVYEMGNEIFWNVIGNYSINESKLARKVVNIFPKTNKKIRYEFLLYNSVEDHRDFFKNFWDLAFNITTQIDPSSVSTIGAETTLESGIISNNKTLSENWYSSSSSLPKWNTLTETDKNVWMSFGPTVNELWDTEGTNYINFASSKPPKFYEINNN